MVFIGYMYDKLIFLRGKTAICHIYSIIYNTIYIHKVFQIIKKGVL